MDRKKFIPSFETKTYEIEGEEADLLATRSILLVEDETAYAEILKEYLETFNYVVTIASDGVQGLKKVMEKDFDLVICDLLMPNLPGDMFYVAVERVKPKLARRFIFITGHQSNPKIADFVKKTKSLTLFKPFDMHVLLETILAAFKPPAKK
jgi:DNA-binding NtrC family response regulator